MATVTSQARDALGRCRVCGDPCAHTPTSQGIESCCATCKLIFEWFRDWLGREVGFPQESVELTTSLIHAHRGDSFGLVELQMELEDEFGVTIPQDVGNRFETLEDAIRCIRLRITPADKRVTRRFWAKTR
jgi:acyl carrier protein